MSRRAWLTAGGILVATWLLYFALRAFYQTPMSLAYASAAAGPFPEFHPHHLAYVPAIQLGFRVARLIWSEVEPLTVLQILNAAWAVAGLLFFWRLARFSLTGGVVVVAVIALGSSRAYWMYATQGDVYVPATASLILVSLAVLRYDGTRLSGLGFVAAVVFSVLIHQANVLICLPVLLWFWWARRTQIAHAVGLVAIAGAIVLSAYLLAFASIWRGDGLFAVDDRHGFLKGFIHFGLFYAGHPAGWGNTSNLSLAGTMQSASGLLGAFVAQPSSPRFEAAWAVLSTAFAILCGCAVVLSALRVRGRESQGPEVLLLSWIAVYFGFFFWWQPGRFEWYMLGVPAILLLLGRALPPKESRQRRFAAGLTVVLIALVAVRNLGSILYFHDTRGPAYAEAEALNSLAPADSVLIAPNSVAQALSYYFRRDVLDTGLVAVPASERRAYASRLQLQSLRYKSVFVPADSLVEGENTFLGDNQIEFLRWLLEIQAAAAGEFRIRATEILVDRQGRRYLLVRTNSQSRIQDLSELFSSFRETSPR